MRFRLKSGSNLKWLYPGMGVKRWLLLLLLGLFFLSLGTSYVYVRAYRAVEFPPPVSSFVYYMTLQFIPHLLRGLILGTIGISMVAVAVFQLNKSLLSVFQAPGQGNLVDIIYQYRRRSRGPKVVAIGGGHGLSTLLRGLKEHTENITAIVTVADDGGSSGRLRQELGVLPPGDFRNCIAALADAEPLMTQLFQYRFGKGAGLDGHTFGNLFITAMAEVTGNFERAILESSRVLAVRGRILPSTLENVTLCADLREEDESGEGLSRVEGESKIPKVGKPIERAFLEPERAMAYPEALHAILEADLILAGPGSLYTSVLPNLLVGDIVRALRASPALKVYICNVATQPGETDRFNVNDHVKALEDHVGRGVFKYVLANSNFNVKPPPNWVSELVSFGDSPLQGYQLIRADVIDPQNPWRHDSKKLAQILMDLYYRESGTRHIDVG